MRGRQSKLLALPMEMRIRIYSFCTVTSVLRLLRTCKKLKEDIDSHWWRDQLNTSFNTSLLDCPLAYKAAKNIWSLSKDDAKLSYTSLTVPGLRGIPGFLTVDRPTDESVCISGLSMAYPEPSGPDPFIQGILTDGQDLLLGFLHSNGSLALAMVDCTDLSRIANFGASKLKSCGWPQKITNAAFHSGMAILQYADCIDIFILKYDQEAPKPVRHTRNYLASAVSINRNYYFLGVDYTVLVFDRNSHIHIADLTGMKSPAIDIIIRDDKVMALSKTEGIYEWNFSSNRGSTFEIPPQKSEAGFDLEGEEHDSMGWARRKGIISNPDTSSYILDSYYGFYGRCKEFERLQRLSFNASKTILQLDMEGRFIGKAVLEQTNPTFTIQDAKTMESLRFIDLKQSSELGQFLGFTLNPRVIVRYFTSGIQMIMITPKDEKIQQVVDDIFLTVSSSRIARVKVRAWPDALLL